MAPIPESSSPSATSLERLKALDKLPNIEAQLSEAASLCNHRARADMIIKWLAAKLKNSPEYRGYFATWDLLCQASRLLSSQRLAATLGHVNIVQLVCATIEDGEVDHDLFQSIETFLLLLYELSQVPGGAAVQTLLSVDATLAAAFTGAWLARAGALIAISGEYNATTQDTALFEPAFVVWDLHKLAADENEAFARHCLTRCARLLVLLPPDTTERGLKRKRAYDRHTRTPSIRERLEVVLAKHLFLPARTSFFDGESVNDSTTKPHISRKDTLTLEDRLADVRHATHSGQLEPAAIPSLLNVALRCVPMVTQKQRSKERLWVETVFGALLECVVAEGRLLDGVVLVDLLKVVQTRASLSTETLSRLATTYGGLNGSSQNLTFTQWDIVAQIVQLDANIFLKTALADLLFDTVTHAERTALQSSQSVREGHKALAPFLRDLVLVPVMHAFGQNRTLAKFFDRWWAQMVARDISTSDSCWTGLVDPISQGLEEHLTADAIANIFEHFRPLCMKDHITKGERFASMVVMLALLQGIRSPDLLDKVHGELELLFDGLSERANDSGVHESAFYWQLLTLVFELWYPLWLSTLEDRTKLPAVAQRITLGAVTHQAIAQLQSPRWRQETVRTVPRTAACFVATLATNFHDLVQTEWRENALETLLGLPFADVLYICTRYPMILSWSVLRTETLRRSLDDAITLAQKVEDVSLTTDPFNTVGMSLAESGDTESLAVLAEVVSTFRDSKKSTEDGQGDRKPDDSRAVGLTVRLQILGELPLSLLPPITVQLVFNNVFALGSMAQWPTAVRNKRLALLSELLTFFNLDLSGENAITLLIGEMKQYSSKKLHDPGSAHSTNDGSNMALLRQFVRHYVTSFCRGRSRYEGNTWLSELWIKMSRRVDSADVRDSGRNETVESALRAVMVLDAISGVIRNENAFQEFLSEAGTDPLEHCVNTLVLAAEIRVERDLGIWEELASVLDGLLGLPRETVAHVVAKNNELQTRLLGMIGQHLTEADDMAHSNPELFVRQSVQLRCFHLLCRLDLWQHSTAAIEPARVALKLIETQLQPRDHHALQLAFATLCAQSTAETKLKMLDEGLLMESCPSANGLLLAQIIMSSFHREDFDGEDAQPPQRLCHSVLESAAQATNLTSCRRACDCLAMILREKGFMTNQYLIEETLRLWSRLEQKQASGLRILYLDYCRIFTILLQQHRSRLRDRLHLVILVLQSLLTNLFCLNKKPTSQSRHPGLHLPLRHARLLARILQLLCNPPPYRGNKHKGSDLIDESRRAQAQVGEYVHYLLHYYCMLILNGTMREGVREALLPGLWAVIEAIEVHDVDGLKSLSAAMNNSERAVLRGLVEEYRIVGR